MLEGIEEQIRKDIATFLKVDVHQFDEKEDLIIDYHLDSLDVFRLSLFLEEKYGIHYNLMRFSGLTSISTIVKETINLLNKNA